MLQICRLYFDLSQPVEAINHFRGHADIFKTKVGPADLAFEHKAWLSKQYDFLTFCLPLSSILLLTLLDSKLLVTYLHNVH